MVNLRARSDSHLISGLPSENAASRTRTLGRLLRLLTPASNSNWKQVFSKEHLLLLRKNFLEKLNGSLRVVPEILFNFIDRKLDTQSAVSFLVLFCRMHVTN
jgi:hypothetical protein